MTYFRDCCLPFINESFGTFVKYSSNFFFCNFIPRMEIHIGTTSKKGSY